MKNGIIVDNCGTKRWYLNDQLHRNDGPAVEWANGDYSWYQHGKRHREDGLAVDWYNIKEWWYHGEQIDCDSQEEFERIINLQMFW